MRNLWMKSRICENRLTQLTENTHKTTVLMLLQFTQKNYKNIKYQPERMFVVNLNKRTRRIHRRHRTTLSPRHGNRLYFDDSIDLELLYEFRSPLPSSWPWSCIIPARAKGNNTAAAWRNLNMRSRVENESTGDGYFISFYVHLYWVYGELLRIVPLSTIEGTGTLNWEK